MPKKGKRLHREEDEPMWQTQKHGKRGAIVGLSMSLLLTCLLVDPALKGQQPPDEVPLPPPKQAATPSFTSQKTPDLTAGQQAIPDTASDTISGGEAITRGTTDVGDLLGKSLSSLGVAVQRRTPIVTEPRVRGYLLGQIVTASDGTYWFPARPDLDTIVSKLDSTLIDYIVVIKGPYSVRYGPGFSFIDVGTLPTPRYDCYFETHGSTSLGFKTNGAGWHGRQSVWGGNDFWGFRVGWDTLAGNDYFDGNHVRIPSSYNSQNFDFAVGGNLTEDMSVEFKYFRLHQRNVEFPGAVTDINRLVTDALNLRFVWDNKDLFERMTFDSWFNETQFEGDNLRDGKRRQIPQLDNLNLNNLLAAPLRLTLLTDGDANSWGFRHATTWGQNKHPQVTLGWDFRYLSQNINEFDTFFLPGTVGEATINFPVPRSRQIDPGLFLDGSLPVGEWLTLKAGARVDHVESRIQQPLTVPQPPPPNPQTDVAADLGPGALGTRNFDMWAAFATAEVKLTEELTLLAGLGTAQRAPTMVELYADGPFLALLQNGFTFVRGQPNLNEEHLNQVDLGIRGDFHRFRGGLSGFYAWVNDYITYDLVSAGTDIPNFNGYVYKNTGLATLAGFEMYGEYDLFDWLTPFATVSYVQGTDRTIDQPLPGIYPLDSRVGFRVHDTNAQKRRWALEFTTRMVATQDQFAATLLEQRTGGFTVFDLRGYWSMTDNLLFTAGVENIGDRQYREHLDLRTGNGVFQPGVNFYLGMRVMY